MKSEKILVIPTKKMEELLGKFQGFLPASEKKIQTLLENPELRFVDREPAETNPQLKQIIPYCILTHKGKILQYERGSTSGESRLHTKLSIGIGGHINPIDSQEEAQPTTSTYKRALERELQEEIHYEKILHKQTLGFVNDESNEVGKVHLGVIETLEVSNPNVFSKEPSIANLCFQTPQSLEDHKTRLEGWSLLALQALKTRKKETFEFTTHNDKKSPLQLHATIKAYSREAATQSLLEILPELVEIHKTLDKKTLEELGIQEVSIKIQKTEVLDSMKK